MKVTNKYLIRVLHEGQVGFISHDCEHETAITEDISASILFNKKEDAEKYAKRVKKEHKSLEISLHEVNIDYNNTNTVAVL